MFYHAWNIKKKGRFDLLKVLYGVTVKLLVLLLFGYEHVHVNVYIFVLYILYYLMYLLLILTWYWHLHVYCWIIQIFRCKVHCSVQSHFQLILLWSVIHIFFIFFFINFTFYTFVNLSVLKNCCFEIERSCYFNQYFRHDCVKDDFAVVGFWSIEDHKLQCYNATQV